MNLAVIPARGASKRIPHKNIRQFCGKPMIAWSIEAAIESECFDRVIVSTDDNEIAAVARKYGADVPFVRPPELSDDYTGTIPVISHATEWQNAHGEEASYVCCIYATAPFVQVDDLKRGLKTLMETEVDYVFTVTNYPFPIQRAIRIVQDSKVEMFQPEYFYARSQDLEEAWHDAGQFYWGKSNAWLLKKPLFSDESSPLVLPRYRVQDIDTEEDWKVAENMFCMLKRSVGLMEKE